MPNRPHFENRPGTDLPGLQAAMQRYTQQLEAYLDAVVGDLEESIEEGTGGGGAPSGAAGGQLGGTYPNPDVRGLRETSGPTLLTAGVISDGQYFKRSGSNLVGALSTGPSLRGFRAIDQGGAYSDGVTRVHVAGYANTGGLFAGTGVHNLQGIGAGQMAYAIPEYFERACTINRLVTRTNGNAGFAGTPRVRMAVYSDGALSAGTLAGSPYPGARLGQSSSIDAYQGASNAILETVGLSIAIPAGTRVWFAIMFNAQVVTNQHNMPALGYLHPVQGFTFNAGLPTTIAQDAVTGGVGWRHAVTFGTTEDFPDPFPQSSPAILADGTNIPVIGFGIQ